MATKTMPPRNKCKAWAMAEKRSRLKIRQSANVDDNPAIVKPNVRATP
jgi:hypothetical protein